MRLKKERKINKDQAIEEVKLELVIDQKELERIIFPKEELLIIESILHFIN